MPSNAHAVASSNARCLRLRAPVARATLRARSTSAPIGSGCGVIGESGRPWCARSCLSATRSCGVALRTFGAEAALRLGLRLGAEAGTSMRRATNSAFVIRIKLAFVRLGALACLGAALGLRLGLTFAASSALNLALLAALRSARVNLRPVCGQ